MLKKSERSFVTVYQSVSISLRGSLLSVDGKNLYPSNPGSAAPLPNHGRPACHGSRKQQNQVWRALEDLGFALIYSIYLSPLNHHLFSKGAPLSWRVDMTKHDESCARVVVTLFARMDQGLSEAKSRVFSSQQQDVLPIQNIYQGSRGATSAFAREVGDPKGISVSLRVVCSFGFAFARVFLCIRRRCLLHFIIFREEMILKVAGSGRRTGRLILARPRVNWTSSTDGQTDRRRRIISLPSGFFFLRSIVCCMNYGGNDDAEVGLDSVSVAGCGVSHPVYSASFLATMRPLRWAASIWPSSILNSVNASSTSCCVNLSPQVIRECLNLQWRRNY